MSLRVTTRSRPRRDWPFSWTATTAAEAVEDELSGPFSMAQLVELIYRVRKVRIVGEISHDRYIDPPPEEEPYTEASSTSVDIVLPRRNTSEIDEAEAQNEVEIFELSASTASFYDMPQTAGFGGFITLIQKDEAGGYWIDLNIATSAEEPGDANFSSSEADFAFEATLHIGGGEIAIPAHVVGLNVTAATCDVTIDEWWPYATSAGAAAWDTATGEPVNGGPGA